MSAAKSKAELRRELAALHESRERQLDVLVQALIAIDSIADRIDVLLDRLNRA